MSDTVTRAAERIAAECLAMRVRRLSRTVTRTFDDALRPLGVSTAQLNLLVAIAVSGPARPSALGRALDLEKSTVTRNLERMRARGWIRTGPAADGGGAQVELEAAGRALLQRALPAWTVAQGRARRLIGGTLAAAMRGVGSRGR